MQSPWQDMVNPSDENDVIQVQEIGPVHFTKRVADGTTIIEGSIQLALARVYTDFEANQTILDLEKASIHQIYKALLRDFSNALLQMIVESVKLDNGILP